MIVYRTENGMTVYETRSDAPGRDFSGGKADYVIDERRPENRRLISDIQSLAPFIEYVINDDLKLIGVRDDAEARARWIELHTEPEPEQEPEAEPETEPETEALTEMVDETEEDA